MAFGPVDGRPLDRVHVAFDHPLESILDTVPDRFYQNRLAYKPFLDSLWAMGAFEAPRSTILRDPPTGQQFIKRLAKLQPYTYHSGGFTDVMFATASDSEFWHFLFDENRNEVRSLLSHMNGIFIAVCMCNILSSTETHRLL